MVEQKNMLNAGLSPKKINHKKVSNVIDISWRDGQLHSLSGDQLRQFCACSKCRARDVVGKQLINESGKIEGLKLMGSTGVQIIFSDGHDRGIYPWGYLRAIANDDALAFLDR
jgi:DUF971 family protein